MQLVVLSVLDFDFSIAVRPLRGASNRNTSSSAGGYLFLERVLLREERCWFGFFSRGLAFGVFGLMGWVGIKVRGELAACCIFP